MIHLPFENRLQFVKYLQRCEIVILHIAAIFFLCLVMVFPAHADGGNANPSNVPGLLTGTHINASAFPAGMITDYGLTDSSMIAVFNGSDTGGANPMTCVVALPSASILHINTYYGSSPNHNISMRGSDNSPDMNNASTACYYSGAWYRLNGAQPWGFNVLLNPSDSVSNTMVTRFDVHNNATTPITGVNPAYGIGANFGSDALMFSANASAVAASLVPNTYTSSPGAFVQYSAGWAGLPFSPFYIDFYEASGGTATNLVYDFPQSSTGTYTFSHIFNSVGTFKPIVVLSTCPAGSTGGGCNHFTISQTGSEVVSTYNPAATLTGTSLFLVDLTNVYTTTPLFFTNDIPTGGLCLPGVVTGLRIFSGGANDAGIPTTSLANNTIIYGTGSLENGTYYPHLHVYCSSTSYYDIYLGNVVTFNSPSPPVGAIPIVVNLGPIPVVTVGAALGYVNGFNPTAIGSGTGYALQSDKQLYNVYEPVSLQWIFNVPFTVGKVVFYKDPALLSGSGDIISFTSTSDIAQNTQHFYQTQYSQAGHYNPKVRIESNAYNPSTPSTYRDVYIGGLNTINASYTITIVQTSPFLLGGTGVNIFNLAGGLFTIALPQNAPVALQAVVSILNTLIQIVVFLASWAFSILSNAPVFNFFTNILIPPAGTVVTFPTLLFNQDLTKFIGTLPRQETISYADANVQYTTLLEAIIGIGLFVHIFKKFFHHE